MTPNHDSRDTTGQPREDVPREEEDERPQRPGDFEAGRPHDGIPQRLTYDDDSPRSLAEGAQGPGGVDPRQAGGGIEKRPERAGERVVPGGADRPPPR